MIWFLFFFTKDVSSKFLLHILQSPKISKISNYNKISNIKELSCSLCYAFVATLSMTEAFFTL
jgi:hypothetical protein